MNFNYLLFFCFVQVKDGRDPREKDSTVDKKGK